MTGLDVALCLASLPVLAATLYLFALTLTSARTRPPVPPPPRLRFAVVVPAHDEEEGIAATVESLLALDYPSDLRRVIVVADNCSDGTAEHARTAGATVLLRVDPARRGKGYALEYAFSSLLADGWADAVVVVDADSLASPNLLRAFSARLDSGALALQARYGVRNPADSWRTRLMTIALAMFHDLRSLGRERLGCSCGLRGNGMCFAAPLLRDHPHQAHSIVEDVEYGIALGRAGHRVHFVEEASVLGVMAVGEAASRPQRKRWEDGRQKMLRETALPLLARGLASRDRVQVDLAMDLLVPPLSRLVAAVLVGFGGALAISGWAGHVLVASYLWGACTLALLAYVGRGIWLSRMGLAGIASLAWAPVYLGWRASLGLARRGRSTAWVRTPREDKK
jgi:cellulose synthase/poly-beta-1,6-N-acetylglucosamine synthase-like glycosyltransferase